MKNQLNDRNVVKAWGWLLVVLGVAEILIDLGSLLDQGMWSAMEMVGLPAQTGQTMVAVFLVLGLLKAAIELVTGRNALRQAKGKQPGWGYFGLTKLILAWNIIGVVMHVISLTQGSVNLLWMGIGLVTLVLGFLALKSAKALMQEPKD